ncbi:hypothetical protein TSAR_001264, partial [Trichomalopsis sarcophagae]
TEAVLNFEDEDFHGHTADTYDWSKHPCRRACKDDEKPKECHYVFVVEMYTTMSKACYDCPLNMTDCFRPHCLPADGVQKPVYVANRQLPGPTIEVDYNPVCKNDRIVVDVRNLMISESTAIHWHGIQQKGTPYMDGVPMVTQCPIAPGNRFKYNFTASTSGSYLWHSHIVIDHPLVNCEFIKFSYRTYEGSQRDDGLFGPLVIHSPPSENVHAELYDGDDKIMFINDWTHLSGNAAFLRDYHYGTQGYADTMLINGLARLNKIEEDDAIGNYKATALFEIRKDRKYRFRAVHAGATDCPTEISIDNHTMLVISMDANDIEPVEVDSIHIWNGERIDFVVKANQEIGNYWIRFRGSGMCKRPRIHQVAILRYETAAAVDPDAPIGYDIPAAGVNKRMLNPHNSGTENPTAIGIPSLTSIAANDESLGRKPDHQFYITYDFYALDNYDFHRRHLYGFYEALPRTTRHSLQLNHITLKLPSFPLLSQSDMIRDNTFCNSTTLAKKNCTSDECSCTHVLQVELNSVVELIMIDEGVTLKNVGIFNHPLHLHGQFFRVVAMEEMTEQVSVDLIKKLDRGGKIKRRLDRAPLKDTVKVPTNGYTIVRFHATNPGYWLYHCHIDLHTNIGMALIFKVGEHSDLPPVPKNFPTCGNFE